MDIRKWFGTGSKNKGNTVTVATCAEASPSSNEEQINTDSEADDLPSRPSPSAAEEPSTSAAVGPPHPAPAGLGCPPDLGTEKPAQVGLKSYPTRTIYSKKRSFHRSWFNDREWLEYSVFQPHVRYEEAATLLSGKYWNLADGLFFCWFYLSYLRQMHWLF